MVNPKTITLSFGKKGSEFLLRGGGQLPKVDPKKSKPSVTDRFVLIVKAIERSLQPKPGK